MLLCFLSLTEERKWSGHECNECLGAGGDGKEGGGHYTGRWHREGPPRSHGQLCTYWERERERVIILDSGMKKRRAKKCPWQLCTYRERERERCILVYWYPKSLCSYQFTELKKHFSQFCIFLNSYIVFLDPPPPTPFLCG